MRREVEFAQEPLNPGDHALHLVRDVLEVIDRAYVHHARLETKSDGKLLPHGVDSNGEVAFVSVAVNLW